VGTYCHCSLSQDDPSGVSVLNLRELKALDEEIKSVFRSQNVEKDILQHGRTQQLNDKQQQRLKELLDKVVCYHKIPKNNKSLVGKRCGLSFV